MRKGCQLQQEKLRTDTEKYFFSYSFIAFFRQYEESQCTCKKISWMCAFSTDDILLITALTLPPNTWKVLPLSSLHVEGL